jgi:polar amino acid transport system substrate-binding protein
MPKPAPAGGVRRALDQEELVLFYQPIHELRTGRIVAAEALLRSQRPNGEIRNAAPIAAAAEQSPDLFRLDSWLVRHAFADAVRWQSEGAPDVRLHVNLSPREFQEGNVIPRLETLIHSCGSNPPKVNIEITEASYIHSPEETTDVLQKIKKNGIQLWLDDFGTGHSSLRHLQLFPLDGIKLPAELIHGINGDHRSQAIARALVALAHELDLRVIAEGVETKEQLAFLDRCKCDYVQGFLFSRPMPLDEFLRVLIRPPAPALPPDSTDRAGRRGRA